MKLMIPAIPRFRCIPVVFSVVFSLIFIPPAFAKTSSGQQEFVENHVHSDVKRGERFFKGLLPHNIQYRDCESCHNIKPSDTLNWNPSAIEIAKKYADKDFASFKNVVMSPGGGMMAKVHTGFQIEDQDLKTVKAYLDHLAVIGPPPEKPSIDHLMLFLLLGVFITWALLELVFFHKVKYKIIPVIILLGALGFQAQMLVTEGIRLGRSPGYAPDQPIKFSHKIHAGDNKIACMYCHHTADQSKSAGIPAMNLCMNCHMVIREDSHTGKFEIAKVVDAVQNKKPVKWVRLHNLPDFVFFSHAIHVGVEKIECQKCHGQVQDMDIMTQHSDLSMGWCVNCHRQTNVRFTQNGYYKTFKKMHQELDSDQMKNVKAADVGANDCMKCHY